MNLIGGIVPLGRGGEGKRYSRSKENRGVGKKGINQKGGAFPPSTRKSRDKGNLGGSWGAGEKKGKEKKGVGA